MVIVFWVLLLITLARPEPVETEPEMADDPDEPDEPSWVNHTVEFWNMISDQESMLGQAVKLFLNKYNFADVVDLASNAIRTDFPLVVDKPERYAMFPFRSSNWTQKSVVAP